MDQPPAGDDAEVVGMTVREHPFGDKVAEAIRKPPQRHITLYFRYADIDGLTANQIRNRVKNIMERQIGLNKHCYRHGAGSQWGTHYIEVKEKWAQHLISFKLAAPDQLPGIRFVEG